MTKESILNFSQIKTEPLWLQERRLTAFDDIDKLPLPEINRVKFRHWNLGDGTVSEDQALANVPDFTALENSPKLVQIGTQTVLKQLPTDLINKGVVFIDFYIASEEIPDIIEKCFGATRGFEEDELATYHTAYFNSAAVLYIPSSVEIEESIEGLFCQDKVSDVPLNKHILIITGRSNRINYLGRFETIGEGDAQVTTNISVKVVALDGSQVEFPAISRLGESVTTYVSRRARRDKDAGVGWTFGIMNEGDVIADFDSDLYGNGSHTNLKVVAASSGHQVQGVDTHMTNCGCNSIDHILQHGVILERGILTFNGIGHIVKGAKEADAQQESRVLMLSDKARSDANPILLVNENGVTTGHAASIGQVDPKGMYYLMSRGLSRDAVRHLVVRGFLGAIITEIPVKEVRDEMIAILDRKLENR